MLPEELVEQVFEELAERRGVRVLLEAAGRVCAPHLATRMQELAARREAAGDGTSKLVSLVGALTVEQLFQIESEGAEDARVVRLTRPGQKHPQLLLIARDRRLPGLPLRLGTLTTPLSQRRIEQLFAQMRADREVPVPADAGEFGGWLVQGARASADLMLGPTADGGEITVQLLRGLGEDELADAISRLYPLETDFEEAGDEIDQELYDELMGVSDTVVEEFEQWLTANAEQLDDTGVSLTIQDVELAGEFRASILGAEVDGPWSDEELDVFLLSWVPAKLATGEDDRARIPASMAFLFRFLGERGDVMPPEADKLARRAIALSETFAERASDPTRRGASGALVEAMLDDDVDLADPDAVRAWMDRFNARPFEERDAILGMSLPAAPRDEDA